MYQNSKLSEEPQEMLQQAPAKPHHHNKKLKLNKKKLKLKKKKIWIWEDFLIEILS